MAVLDDAPRSARVTAADNIGKQVGVLVPTTVLAEQHERSFKSRFAAPAKPGARALFHHC